METKKFVLKYDFPCTVQGSMPDFVHIDRGICMMVKNYLTHTGIPSLCFADNGLSLL
jgi:hypothetical protein